MARPKNDNFLRALLREPTDRTPLWLMRQAGRYHSHYQMLKRYADFIALCKDPQLAAETAMGPVHDFNFDAAILFSVVNAPILARRIRVEEERIKAQKEIAAMQVGATAAAAKDKLNKQLELEGVKVGADIAKHKAQMAHQRHQAQRQQPPKMDNK